MSITMKDIAKEAGVAVSAVSYAINGTGSVSEEKKKRILDLVGKHDYRPNVIARNLKQRKTRIIGILSNLQSLGPDRIIIASISDECTRRNYNVLQFNKTNNIKQTIDILRSNQVEGIIYVDDRTEVLADNCSSDIPIVFAYCHNEVNKEFDITPNDVQGGYIATRHLIEKKHRRVGCITGNEGWQATEDRLKGYKKAIAENGIPFDADIIVTGDFLNKDNNYQAALQLLSMKKRPTAVFCFCDAIAISVYNAAYELGMSIPEDVAVVGFDNEPFTQYVRPPITTVSMPLKEIGVEAVEVLFSRIDNSYTRQNNPHNLNCELIVRGSS